MKKIFLYCGSLIVLLSVLAVTAYIWFIFRCEEQIFDAGVHDLHANQFLADQQYMANQPDLQIFFPNNEKGYDAGLFINQRIQWTNEKAIISESLTEWIVKIHKFSYWNLESIGPLAEYIAGHETSDLSLAPAPVWQNLRKAMQERLARGQREGNLEKALDEARHLTALIASTESFIATMTAWSMLRDIESYFPKATRRSEEDWQRVRRALWGLAGYFQFGLKPELTDRIFAQPRSLAGLCGAANESVAQNYLMFHLLGPFYPEQISNLNYLYATITRHCRSRRGVQLWQNRQELPQMLHGDVFRMVSLGGGIDAESKGPTDPGESQWIRVRSIPFIHKLIGLTLASIMNPSYLRHYDDADQ